MIGDLLSSNFLNESNIVTFNIKEATTEMDSDVVMYNFLMESDKEFTDMQIEAYRLASISENSEEVLHEGLTNVIKTIFNKIIEFIKDFFNKFRKNITNNRSKEFDMIMKIGDNKSKTITVNGYQEYTSINIPNLLKLALDNPSDADTVLQNYLHKGQSASKFDLNYNDGKKYVEIYDEYASQDIKKIEQVLLKEVNNMEKDLINSNEYSEQESVKRATECKKATAMVCNVCAKITAEYKKTIDNYFAALKKNNKED